MACTKEEGRRGESVGYQEEGRRGESVGYQEEGRTQVPVLAPTNASFTHLHPKDGRVEEQH
jgi:hypothetical protein